MKIALLIGVSTYQPGLTPLPSAEKDVQKLQQVLQTPEIGGFEQVKSVVNPDPLEMQREIETLFGDRDKDDLVFLFFTGHGIKDDSGRLYFATRLTQKTPKGELVKSTAVPASFVQEIMGNSRSRRQVLMLDCCFSGAFAEGMTAKDDGRVDVQRQLGGEGRAVLTSSTSSQYSFEQQGSDLSVYTRYIVEGIETGAADQDNDGDIAINELHEYAKRKVQEIAPAMKPEIYAIKEGFTIKLARALVGDPKLRYRREVERFAERGEISDIARMALDARYQKLGLSAEDAEAIETEVLKPYRTYRGHLRQYAQKFAEALTQEFPISETTREDLDYLQKALGLRNEDVRPIEVKILASRGATPDTVPSNNPGILTPPVPATATPLERSEPAIQPFYQEQAGGSGTYPQSRPPEQPAVPPYAPSVTAPYGQPVTASKPRQNNWLMSLALVLLLGAGAAGAYWGVMWWRSQQQYQVTVQQQEAALKQSLDFAARDQWKEAIAVINQIPAGSSTYVQAQGYLSDWSARLLQQATDAYNQGKFEEAVALAQSIPQNSPQYTKVQTTIDQWQQEWPNDQRLVAEAKQGLEAQWDINGAMLKRTEIKNPALQQQLDQLITQFQQRQNQSLNQKQAEELQRQARLNEQLRRENDNLRQPPSSPSEDVSTSQICYEAIRVPEAKNRYVNVRSGPNPVTNRIGAPIDDSGVTVGDVMWSSGITQTAKNEEGELVEWIYITAPKQGWVSSRFANRTPCPPGGGGGSLR